jgi:hypothetical protein
MQTASTSWCSSWTQNQIIGIHTVTVGTLDASLM